MKMKRFCMLSVVFGLFLSGCMEDPAAAEEIRLEQLYDELKACQNERGLLDFAKIQQTNPEIYAWIEIPGTDVDYPVLQSASDDERYLYTACDGSEAISGSVFTQASYNGIDFNDPVTVLYGNAMSDGSMFGGLQTMYSGESTSEGYSDIVIHLPEEVRHYTVFASVPYDDTHILYTYDFSNSYWYGNFFSNISKIRSIGAFFKEELAPEFGDHVVILSTSLMDESDGRFLVMAVLHDDIAASADDAP